MSYWLEERTELALRTKRYSHAPLYPQMIGVVDGGWKGWGPALYLNTQKKTEVLLS